MARFNRDRHDGQGSGSSEDADRAHRRHHAFGHRPMHSASLRHLREHVATRDRFRADRIDLHDVEDADESLV